MNHPIRATRPLLLPTILITITAAIVTGAIFFVSHEVAWFLASFVDFG